MGDLLNLNKKRGGSEFLEWFDFYYILILREFYGILNIWIILI